MGAELQVGWRRMAAAATTVLGNLPRFWSLPRSVLFDFFACPQIETLVLP